MQTYRCQTDDTLDEICWKHYGRLPGVVEQVLEANPGLAANGPVLPEGLSISLPDLPEAEPQQTLKLWD